MEKENEVQMLFKVRNTMSCLLEGFTLLAKNLLSLIKYLWPTLVLVALAVALLTTFCSMLMVPASFGNVSAISRTLVLAGVLMLVYVLSAVFLGGQVFTYMQKFGELGYFPNASIKKLWKPVRHNAWRYFLVSVSVVAFFILLTVALSSLLALKGVMARPVLETILSFLVVAVVFLLIIPFLFMAVSYMMEANPLRKSFIPGLKQGFKSYGSIFVIILVGGISILIVQAIGNLPNGILIMCRYNSILASVQGDPTDLPASFGVLQFLFSFIGEAINILTELGICFSLVFLYGSIIARRRDKERYEAERLALQGQ
jgi:hypothetical protein